MQLVLMAKHPARVKNSSSNCNFDPDILIVFNNVISDSAPVGRMQLFSAVFLLQDFLDF